MVILTIMESQPRSEGGSEGKSSDEIVYELADGVINTILTKIQTEEVNIYMFKVKKYGSFYIYNNNKSHYRKMIKVDCHRLRQYLPKKSTGIINY